MSDSWMKSKVTMMSNLITPNGSRLGEVAEHKTSLEL